MLPELMGEDGGVEPVKGQLAPLDHFDQRFEHFGLLPHLVAEAELLGALDEVERLHAHCANSRLPDTNCCPCATCRPQDIHSARPAGSVVSKSCSGPVPALR